jgi:tetratricopeptide (TPR) repeat protein
MGFSYEKLDQFDKAIESYQKAVGFEPNYALAHYNLANAYKHKKRFDKAIESYEKATGVDPNYASAWLFMGYTYLNKNDYYSAIENLEKAIKIKPDLGKDIETVIGSIKKSIQNLNNSLLEKFKNK